MPETTVNKEAIAERLTEALVEFGEEKANVTLDAKFEELDVDSLDLVEMAQIVEDDYDVEISDEDMDKLKTVGDAVDFVASRVS